MSKSAPAPFGLEESRDPTFQRQEVIENKINMDERRQSIQDLKRSIPYIYSQQFTPTMEHYVSILQIYRAKPTRVLTLGHSE